MDAIAKKNVREQERANWYGYVKRVQDMVLAAAALLILWPCFLLISLLILLDDPSAGPIFAQTRVGKDGREFRLYKFRTMRPDAEIKFHTLLSQNEMDGPVFKIKNDPRITRVGRFLRRSGLDELPQFWNVLRGEMSIVGPRPALPREVIQYSPWERQRLWIKPGLTCYWQIQPQRNTLSFAQWMDLDMTYLEDQSFLTDWKIIFSTFQAIARMDGQ